MNIDLNDKQKVKRLIDSGIPCFYRLGFPYVFRSGGDTRLTKEKALELLPNYSPGVGFYVLSLEKHGVEDFLLFNEFTENDLW